MRAKYADVGFACRCALQIKSVIPRSRATWESPVPKCVKTNLQEIATALRPRNDMVVGAFWRLGFLFVFDDAAKDNESDEQQGDHYDRSKRNCG